MARRRRRVIALALRFQLRSACTDTSKRRANSGIQKRHQTHISSGPNAMDKGAEYFVSFSSVPPFAGKAVNKTGINVTLSTGRCAAAFLIPAMPQSGRLFSIPSPIMQSIEKQRKRDVLHREVAGLLRRLIQKIKKHPETRNIFFRTVPGPDAGVFRLKE